MQSCGSKLTGEISITHAVQALRATIKEVNRGDLGAAETILCGQAAASRKAWEGGTRKMLRDLSRALAEHHEVLSGLDPKPNSS
jgi:hypothetical protein